MGLEEYGEHFNFHFFVCKVPALDLLLTAALLLVVLSVLVPFLGMLSMSIDSLFHFSRYSAKFVKEYVEASEPEFAVGEFWDSCSYDGVALDYNQGKSDKTRL